MNVLVTGATGYVGGRLVPRLVDRGHHVRVLVRDPSRVRDQPWASRVEVVAGDVLDAASVAAAAEGMDVAYYLVHSMHAGRGYRAIDRDAAHAFARGAAGVGRVIYLGGLQPAAAAAPHLASRAEVGRILAESIPTLELRAGPVIGSGSASFEVVRYLAERLPVMVTPKWISTPVQPIGVRDLLAYLLAALDVDATGIVEIGAPPVSFADMLQQYARVRGLPPRRVLTTPLLAPRLAARWIGLVSPVPNALAVPLIEAIQQPLYADTARARALFPAIEPMAYPDAVRLALHRVEQDDVETHWSAAAGPRPPRRRVDEKGLMVDERAVHVDAAPEDVFGAVTRIGGRRRWPAWDLAWGLRGWVGRVLGGPGARPGRRHPDGLRVGEALDFWRVEELRPGELLRLRAEMPLPGRAWLEFRVEPDGSGARLVQTARFEPLGLGGALYWYALYPAHARIFRGLADTLRRTAERRPPPVGRLRGMGRARWARGQA